MIGVVRPSPDIPLRRTIRLKADAFLRSWHWHGDDGMEASDLKAQSERVILRLGGKVCASLPILEQARLRSAPEVCDRALVLHAMLAIYFGAPHDFISSWIERNRLEPSLSIRDRATLAKPTGSLSQQERVDLYWYIEALWAMAWAGQLIDDLPVDAGVGDNLASLLPDIRREAPTAFRRRFQLRTIDECGGMLDLYYRAHWYARDGQLNGYATEPFILDVIMERRKALEWICDAEIADWDEAPQDT